MCCLLAGRSGAQRRHCATAGAARCRLLIQLLLQPNAADALQLRRLHRLVGTAVGAAPGADGVLHEAATALAVSPAAVQVLKRQLFPGGPDNALCGCSNEWNRTPLLFQNLQEGSGRGVAPPVRGCRCGLAPMRSHWRCAKVRRRLVGMHGYATHARHAMHERVGADRRHGAVLAAGGFSCALTAVPQPPAAGWVRLYTLESGSGGGATLITAAAAPVPAQRRLQAEPEGAKGSGGGAVCCQDGGALHGAGRGGWARLARGRGCWP